MLDRGRPSGRRPRPDLKGTGRVHRLEIAHGGQAYRGSSRPPSRNEMLVNRVRSPAVEHLLAPEVQSDVSMVVCD